VTNPRIALAYELYWNAFDRLRKVGQIHTLEENEEFCTVLQQLLDEHRVVVPQLVTGIRECRDYITPEEADRFIMESLRSRVSRRVLAEQHIALTHQLAKMEPDGKLTGSRIGIVETRCSARMMLERCIQSAMQATLRDVFEDKPASSLVDYLPQVHIDGKPDCEFMGITKHVEYALHEVIYNAARVTMHKRLQLGMPEDTSSDALTITVAEGDLDLVFRVSDRAGGIPKGIDDPTHILGIPTASSTDVESSALVELEGCVEQMKGQRLGVGLLMARVYTEYWGGGVRWRSLCGWGTDVYVRMCKRGTRIEQIASNCSGNGEM